ncbi:MAG TPA: 1-deoxy-D-xylulose-5-phosphate synthase, partial [Blastocatellia bacterium]|nr:1-deoxy-D-xylulose-5-phosphate synthase [Blastocatellia bacterium]
LKNIKDIKGPVLLHVLTEKGKDYKHAAVDVDKLHGMSPFDVETGKKHPTSGPISYTNAFADALIKVAQEDKRIVAITAAMKSGTGLDKFEKAFPDRMFDVGIAEQHAVTFAGGLAREGMKPVCAIYSTFLQRGFDQVLHDVALQKLPVIFALDRAGLVGDDGPTHNGPFDIAYLRIIPNMTIMVPKDENELGHMVKTAAMHDGPSSIRYPRGNGLGKAIEPLRALEIGKAEILQKERGLLIVGVGPMLYDAQQAAKELNVPATIINARFVKPLDEELIIKEVKQHGHILTLEEGQLAGGFGSSILELLNAYDLKIPVTTIAIADEFIEHGKPAIQKQLAGIDKDSIKKTIAEIYQNGLSHIITKKKVKK